MKSRLMIALVVFSSAALAQKPVTYPAHGQSPQQQSRDDGACYSWAKSNTGIDPAVIAGTPVPAPGPTGARVGGAARGAAAGAMIGDVNHHDPGHGAAVGATAGALVGGARARSQAAAQVHNAQAGQQAQMNTYWRAYAACMQGRGYTVQ
jgi:hypothetical protein